MNTWKALGIIGIGAFLGLGASLAPIPLSVAPQKTVCVAVVAQRYLHGPGTISPVLAVPDVPNTALAWTGSEPGLLYTIIWGANAMSLTNSTFVGTNTAGIIMVPKTNSIVTVTGTYRDGLSGKWIPVAGWSPIILTNPAGPRFYSVGITVTNQ